MNKDLEFLLAIIIFLLVAKNICGKTREDFSCEPKKCSMAMCSAVKLMDPTAKPEEIAQAGLDPTNEYHGDVMEVAGSLVDCNQCSDDQGTEAAMDLIKNFKQEAGVCQRTDIKAKEKKKSGGFGGSAKKKSGGFGGKKKTGGFGGRARTSSRAKSSGGGCRANSPEATDRECQSTCIDIGGSTRSTLPLCKNHCTGCR